MLQTCPLRSIGVHGGGFIINELMIARTVTKAIRESPELGGAG